MVGSGRSLRLPALKTGGLYKIGYRLAGGFVAAVTSRAFRDVTGIFTVKLSHDPEGTERRGSSTTPPLFGWEPKPNWPYV